MAFRHPYPSHPDFERCLDRSRTHEVRRLRFSCLGQRGRMDRLIRVRLLHPHRHDVENFAG